MAQHDYDVANGSGAVVRADLNSLAGAIVTQNSGATAPAVTFANMFWYDTANALLKMRNPANSAWITIASISGSTFALNSGVFAAASVANSVLANMANATIKGRYTAGTGVPEDLTAAQVQALLQTNSPLSGMRNRIINGDFDIWQRGTSFTTNVYGADRWLNIVNGSTYVNTRQTHTLGQTAVPGNPTYYNRTVVTSVANANNYVGIICRIEGVKQFAGKTVTITFYGKADAAKNIALEMYQLFGTGGSPSSDVSTPIGLKALTTSFTKLQATIAIPSISGKTLGTAGNDFLALVIWFDAGSTFATRASSVGQQSGTFEISHVSIVEGDATLETDCFSPRHIQQEIALCQRYYQKSFSVDTAPITNLGIDLGEFCWTAPKTGAANDFSPRCIFPTIMRAIPTVTFYNPGNANSQARDTTAGGDCSSTTTFNVAPNGFSVNTLGNASTAIGNALRVQWAADAEI